MTKCVWGFMAATLLAISFPASGWDFDKTRARDIMDRAANDGDATARLLVAMALDERIDTGFDDYEFRLPPSKDPEQLYIQWLDHDHIYSNLMYVSRKHASMRIPANVTGHSGDRDRFAHGHHAGVSFVL